MADQTKRRLIGWRVRWEYRRHPDGAWRADVSRLWAMADAWSAARLLRGDERTRNVRVVRVYRRPR